MRNLTNKKEKPIKNRHEYSGQFGDEQTEGELGGCETGWRVEEVKLSRCRVVTGWGDGEGSRQEHDGPAAGGGAGGLHRWTPWMSNQRAVYLKLITINKF